MKTNKVVVLLVVLGLLLAACQSAPTESPKSSPRSTSTKVQSTKVVKPTNTKAPTATPRPSPTPTVPAQKIEILEERGVVQDGQLMGMVFFVRNPNSGLGIEDSEYEIRLYDENDVLIDSRERSLYLIMPGEKAAIVETFYLDEGQKVDHFDFTIDEGDYFSTNITNSLFPITVQKFVDDDYFPYLIGVVENPSEKLMENLTVYGIAYDVEGNIVGFGESSVDFIHPNSESGVRASMTFQGEPETFEFYVSWSWMTDVLDPVEQSIELINFGYTQEDEYLNFGILVRNLNEKRVLESSKYQIVIYGINGEVLGLSNSIISYILAGETIGVSDRVYLMPGEIERVSIQFLPGDATQYTISSTPFIVNDVVIEQGSYTVSAKGTVENPMSEDVKDLILCAIFYDADNKIVGGEITYVDLIPANGKASFEITSFTNITSDHVEVYPVQSILTKIGD